MFHSICQHSKSVVWFVVPVSCCGGGRRTASADCCPASSAHTVGPPERRGTQSSTFQVHDTCEHTNLYTYSPKNTADKSRNLSAFSHDVTSFCRLLQHWNITTMFPSDESIRLPAATPLSSQNVITMSMNCDKSSLLSSGCLSQKCKLTFILKQTIHRKCSVFS